ncbi:hypothetical protein BDW22DRAFT_706151 [Trametopsis cervina]|nr:hypothetical protein BDW22DRAFT_706151 [Trametopsis cervina]
MSGFVFTDHMVTVSNQLWAVTSAVGAVLCFLVLIVIFGLGFHRSSRVHLDRVSFRLLKWALVANMFFGIFSAVGGSLTGPGFLCGFSIFVLQLTLEWSCLLLFAIALNLQLVVVHHINGQRMERYYLWGAGAFALAITVPPYAAKQYGWDPLVQDCWYTNDNQRERLAWQIGTQLVWTGITVIGEVVSSVTVIAYMLRHQAHRRKLGVSSLTSAARSTTSGSVMRPVDHANAYRTIILRIAMYPLTSCVINLTSIMCVIHATVTDGVHTRTDYNILLLSDFLYGGRAVVYALLAVTDPALLRAAKAFISHILGRPFPRSSHKEARGMLGSRATPVFVSFELDTIKTPSEYTRGDGTKSAASLTLAQSASGDGGENGHDERERPFRDVMHHNQHHPGEETEREMERMREVESALFRRQI